MLKQPRPGISQSPPQLRGLCSNNHVPAREPQKAILCWPFPALVVTISYSMPVRRGKRTTLDHAMRDYQERRK